MNDFVYFGSLCLCQCHWLHIDYQSLKTFATIHLSMQITFKFSTLHRLRSKTSVRLKSVCLVVQFSALRPLRAGLLEVGQLGAGQLRTGQLSNANSFWLFKIVSISIVSQPNFQWLLHLSFCLQDKHQFRTFTFQLSSLFAYFRGHCSLQNKNSKNFPNYKLHLMFPLEFLFSIPFLFGCFRNSSKDGSGKINPWKSFTTSRLLPLAPFESHNGSPVSPSSHNCRAYKWIKS